ncbi:MAG: tetratricopeptide repeat protein [Phycisphaerales bacterium]|nr:tetratricopeptide repeat protein [Phycisphaerales bacterium]
MMKHTLICVLVLLPVLMSGCGESKADKDAATNLKLGNIDYDNGRYGNAIIAYQKSIDLKPDYAEAYLNMGNAYYEMGQYESALAAYDKYTALAPAGDIHRKTASDKSNEARKRLNERFRNDMIASYREQGYSHYKAKRYKETILALKKYIALKTDDAMVYYMLGSAYEKLKQYPKALTAFKKLLALKPTGKMGELSESVRKRIREIKNRDKP